MIFKGLALLLALLGTNLHAEVVTLSKEARGTGESRGEAVLTALDNAVGKAFGFRLEGELQRYAAEHSSYTSDGGSEKLISSVSREISKRTNTPLNQPVVGYEVLAAYETSLGWEAQVRIDYKSYKQLGASDNRRTLVVYAESSEALNLAEGLEAALVASRRFDVLKRDSFDAFEREKAFIRGADAAVGEEARLGQGEGADYLVLVESLGRYSRDLPVRVIKATGERLLSSEAGLNYNVEVVEFSSREVKWRRSGALRAEAEDTRVYAEKKLAQQVSQLTTALATSLVSSIYPARIAKVMGSQAVLNRGEGSINLGQRVNVYESTESLSDPQSGESLGALEIQVATAEVIEVKPKFSMLRIVEGSLSVNGDYIVRWDTAKRSTAAVEQDIKAEKQKRTGQEKAKKIDDAFLN